MSRPIYLASGLRTPFTRVDGGLAEHDAIGLGVHVVKAMAATIGTAPIDAVAFGTVIPSLRFSNLAREIWLDAKLDPTVPTWSVVMACSTSMLASFELASQLARGNGELALAGGVESMSHVQVGLTQPFSDWLRHATQAKDWKGRAAVARELPTSHVVPHLPSIKNRTTGKSMGEHSEETNKVWGIGREEQDELAYQSHARAVAAQGRGFFDSLITPVGATKVDAFPRKSTTVEALAKLRLAFDTTSGKGTITAGNSSPLTDGAAGIWVASESGLARLPAGTPHVRLVDFESCAVDIADGLLMAPTYGIPRLLARNGLRYDDVALWEIHEAFSGQVLYQLKALETRDFVRTKAKVDSDLGAFPRDRINPNGGSVALGHPFGATGARILSQAVKELAAMPKGSKAIVSICADGGVGTVALLEH